MNIVGKKWQYTKGMLLVLQVGMELLLLVASASRANYMINIDADVHIDKTETRHDRDVHTNEG